MHTPLGFQNKILRGFLDPFYKNRVKKLFSGPEQKLISLSSKAEAEKYVNGPRNLIGIGINLLSPQQPPMHLPSSSSAWSLNPLKS
jgi:hypothetical protein